MVAFTNHYIGPDVHVMPDTPFHDARPDCWCKPKAEPRKRGNGKQFTHKVREVRNGRAA